IPPGQVVHLSDAAREPNSPVKAVIENTLADFLKSSRAHDRLLILFAGHGVEIEGEAYLVPIEGGLGDPKTLIPLEWVYQQLEQGRAGQKVRVVDVCRLNPSKGTERPAEGPMSPKFDLALKNPPRGVQVWAACTEGQQSYEFEDFRLNNGVFMEALWEAAGSGVQGVLQKPGDPLPLAQRAARASPNTKTEGGLLRVTRPPRRRGGARGGGGPSARGEGAPPQPLVARLDAGRGLADAGQVRSVLRELNVPPVKKNQA